MSRGKDLLIGILIGATATTLVGKVDTQAIFNGKGTANYASSDLYRNTAPSAGEYLKETPILKAVVDDIDWKMIEDSKDISYEELKELFGNLTDSETETSEDSKTLYYEGVFENWTDVDINRVKLELKVLTKDGVLLEENCTFIDNVKSKEKVLVKIRIPDAYMEYISKNKEVEIKVVGKSRDFKNKPFNKEQ